MRGIRESLLIALAICGAARGSDGFAADSAPKFALPRSQFALPLLPLPLLAPSFSAAPRVTEPEAFSPTEFRPRARGFMQLGGTQSEMRLADMPRPQDNSMAQQLAEFKSQDRLRLLTLWQSHASSLSLQAGKHGAPSLQWSTPWVRRETSPRGLLDRLLAVSPRGAFGGARNVSPRQPNLLSPSKPQEFAAAARPP